MPDWNAIKNFPVHPSEYPLLKSLDLQFVNKISVLRTHDKWIPSLPDGHLAPRVIGAAGTIESQQVKSQEAL